MWEDKASKIVFIVGLIIMLFMVMFPEAVWYFDKKLHGKTVIAMAIMLMLIIIVIGNVLNGFGIVK